MARSAAVDHLQNYAFWLFDIGPASFLGLPLFTPTLGFKSISAPEVTLDTEEISECNWHWKRKVLRKGNAGSMTLERGVLFFDSDFYRWLRVGQIGKTSTGINGNVPTPGGLFEIGGPTYRRNLLLVQFFPRFGMGVPGITAGAISTLGASTAVTTGVGVEGLIAGAAKNSAASLAFLGPLAARLPARAYLLSGCIPTRYKPLGDFDATDSDVSIAELEMEMDSWVEIGLAS